MLSREYWVSGNRFSRLLFTNEDPFYANLHDQKQSTNMSSLCQYLAFVWRYRFNCVTFPSQNRQKWQNEQSITVLAGLCARSGHNLACKIKMMYGLTLIPNFDSLELIRQRFSLVTIIAESPHSWPKIVIRDEWKPLPNGLTRDKTRNWYWR